MHGTIRSMLQLIHILMKFTCRNIKLNKTRIMYFFFFQYFFFIFFSVKENFLTFQFFFFNFQNLVFDLFLSKEVIKTFYSYFFFSNMSLDNFDGCANMYIHVYPNTHKYIYLRIYFNMFTSALGFYFFYSSHDIVLSFVIRNLK